MRARVILLCFLTIPALLLAATAPRSAAQYPQTEPSRYIAIKAGKLLDPEKGTTASNQTILVHGRPIEAVGGNVSVPPGAEGIDLSKATVLPQLFEAPTPCCITVKRERHAR